MKILCIYPPIHIFTIQCTSSFIENIMAFPSLILRKMIYYRNMNWQSKFRDKGKHLTKLVVFHTSLKIILFLCEFHTCSRWAYRLECFAYLRIIYLVYLCFILLQFRSCKLDPKPEISGTHLRDNKVFHYCGLEWCFVMGYVGDEPISIYWFTGFSWDKQ